MKKIKIILGIACCVGTLIGSPAHAGQTTADSFEKAKNKELLAGRDAEFGDVQWGATENVQITGKRSENALSVTDSQGFVARVPVPDHTAVTVEAEVRPTAEGGGDPWIAIGLGGGSINPGSVNVNWAKGLFLLVTAKGRYQCIINPSGSNNVVQLLGGEVANFTPGDAIPLKLEYKKEENTVSMWVNGRIVLKNHDLGQNGFTPSLPYAGVSGYGQVPDEPLADNFSLSAD